MVLLSGTFPLGGFDPGEGNMRSSAVHPLVQGDGAIWEFLSVPSGTSSNNSSFGNVSRVGDSVFALVIAFEYLALLSILVLVGGGIASWAWSRRHKNDRVRFVRMPGPAPLGRAPAQVVPSQSEPSSLVSTTPVQPVPPVPPSAPPNEPESAGRDPSIPERGP